MKKTIGFLICLCIGWQWAVAEVIHGTCGVDGDNVTWSLDTESETLTFSGTGAMADSIISIFRDYTIKNIVVDEGVTNVSWHMIGSCGPAANLVVSSTVEEMAVKGYRGINNLSFITVSEDNAKYCSQEGILYSKDKTELLLVPSQMPMRTFIVSEGVTHIGDYAMSSCWALDSLVIAETILSVGECCFPWDIKVITWLPLIPPGTNSYINYWDEIVLYVPAESIYLYRESSFSDTWDVNGERAKARIIPIIDSTILVDDDGVYYKLISETYRTLKVICNPYEPYSGDIEVTGNSARGYSSYVVGDTTIWSNVSIDGIDYCIDEIGDYAFYGCQNLTSVSLPLFVRRIGNYAFHGCPNLQSVGIHTATAGDLPKFTTIGDYAFYECPELSTLELPETLKDIGKHAFACTSIEKLSIPASVTRIGLNIVANVPTLEEITVDAANVVYDSRDNCNAIIETATNNLLSACNRTFIPDDIVRINSYAIFSTTISRLILPSKLEYIGLHGITSNCLSEVICKNTIPPFCYGIYILGEHAKTLYVPMGSVEMYRNSYFGSCFSDIIGYGALSLNDSVATYRNDSAFVCEEVTYTRVFGNTEWQPWYMPFAVDCDSLRGDFDIAYLNDVHQYDDDNDGVIDRTELEAIKMNEGVLRANYPYLIKAKTVGEKTVTMKEVTIEAAEECSFDCTSMTTRYVFTGTYSRMTGAEMAAAGLYGLQNGELAQARPDDRAVGAFRWYLSVEERDGHSVNRPQRISLRIQEDTSGTGMEILNDLNRMGDDIRIRDLQGRIVRKGTEDASGLPRGVYIVNGKKVMVY